MAGLVEGSFVSGYRIVRAVGAGQMGDVYEVVDRSGTTFALKVLRTGPWGNEEVVARFRREASISASILHPNVVVVFEHGVVEGKPFLVMPLFRGEDFASCLERTGPLRPVVATSIVRAAALGLEAAHANGIIHRDFKPANLFLDERNDEIVPVVCDFGIAKHLAEEGGLTATGAVLGTPLFMAPEQLIDSKRVTPRCDVWALGMTLYAALAGRSAFEDVGSMQQLILETARGHVPPIQTFAPWVQPGLASVVHAALLPVDRRLGSVRDFINALDQWAPRPLRLTKADLVALPPADRSIVAASAPRIQAAAELGTANDSTVNESTATPLVDPFIDRVLAERYRIVDQLGAGGMGAVYAAVDLRAPTDVDSAVAIKVMHVEGGPRGVDGTRRFLREAKAAQRVQHPNVTRVLDTGVDEAGVPFLVMERLRGTDLSHLIGRAGKMVDARVTITLFVQACEALAAAHALGIVHRDIKPANLFVHESPAGVSVKVSDFGIAKQLAEGGVEASAELTQTGGMLGSPLYMSPEQAKSAKNVDARSDIYSLSLSLHEALSGMRPWQGRSTMGEIILAVCTEDIPPLDLVAPWVDPGVARVVERGLQRDRDRRLGSALELATLLRPFALARPLTKTDLTPIHTKDYGNLSRTLDMSAGRARTADPVAYTDPGVRSGARQAPIPTPKTPWLLAGGIAAAAAIAVGVFTQLPRLRGTHVSTAASVAPPSAIAVPEPPHVEPAVVVVVDAGAPPAVSVSARPQPPKIAPRSSVAPAPAAAAPAPAPASTVGRGGTATDLPP